jgi:hypothetical protein
MDADLPLQGAWDFYTNPTNWPKWEDRLESCTLDETFLAGYRVRAKIKNKAAWLAILVTDVKPYQESKHLITIPLFSQESLTTYEEIAARHTRITTIVRVSSFLVPFMKGVFIRNAEKSRIKSLAAFTQLADSLSSLPLTKT